MEQIPSPIPSPTTTGPIYPMMSADHPKILQNLLYGHGYLTSTYAVPGYATHPHLDDPFRPRSGSLQSLGSTGSSHRPDRSPSRESTSSHESLMRASPISLAPESPSPSPPTGNDSKLFNILKGNMPSPYAPILNLKPHRPVSMDPAPPLPKRQISLQEPPRRPEVSSTFTKRHIPVDEGPIDLSFKKSKVEASQPRRFTMPSETITRASMIRAKIAAKMQVCTVTKQHDFLEPISPPPRAPSRDSVHSNDEEGGSSILRSILSGNSQNTRTSLTLSVSRDRQAMSAPTSPAPNSFSAPPSPHLGLFGRLNGASPCEQNQRVTIAKKTVFPVRARVTDWLQKTVQFAKSLPEFSSLSDSEQLTLVTNAWSRMLLLYMAENHFEFAVTPVVIDNESNHGDDGRSDLPTMKSVESIESFVKKCQTIGLDAIEYQCIKTAVLYQTGVAGLSESREKIEAMGNEARRQLQKHVTITKSHEKMRYSSILLLLHTLSGINASMVQNLFCKLVLKDMSMEDYMKNLLFQSPVTE